MKEKRNDTPRSLTKSERGLVDMLVRGMWSMGDAIREVIKQRPKRRKNKLQK